MEHITNPHDKFVKDIFSRSETAKEFFANYLPPAIVEALDLESLEYRKDSFVDKHLKEFFSDLLFRVPLKNGSLGYVYILFEHKSHEYRGISFQIIKYMVKIWEMARKTERLDKLPVIIPFVFYHGEKRWRVGLHFRELFDCPEELYLFIPDFKYILWDASQYSDEEIKGATMTQVALLLLKYIFREDLRERLSGILQLLRELSGKETGMECIETILRYLVNAAPRENIKYEDIRDAAQQALSKTGGEIMPTVAESLIEQGLQQGLQQGLLDGMQQGKLQEAKAAILEILESRFDVLPPSILKTVESIPDLAILKLLRKKALAIESLQQFEKVMEIMTS